MAYSDSDSGEDGALSGEKEYDVTNICFKCTNCCMGKMILHLEPEEAVLDTSTCISSSSKRLPYGELGSVEHSTACGCCHVFNSNLSPTDENGNKQGIAPGFGCDAELVEEVVAELKQRMKGRGDTGNIQRAEQALRLMRQAVSRSAHQEAKVDAVLRSLGVQAPPAESMGLDGDKVTYEDKEYDVTGCCHRLCTCCIGKQILNLDTEEADFEQTTCCSRSVQKRPYGELGSVEASRCCGVCVAVNSGLGAMVPGFGCEEDLVNEVVEELKMRMKGRGDTGNIQRQEETLRLVRQDLNKLAHLDSKIDALLRHQGIPVPPPPVQQMM